MTSAELKERTKKFSISIINMIEKLPNSILGRTIANQIVRSGTSVGANYRSVCRARSDREFIAKMGIVLEEADETLFWLEIIDEKQLIAQPEIGILQKEADELTAIFVASLKTVKAKSR